MLRGNGGQRIFFDDEDRCRFCLLLQEGTERFGYRIHGFCLMGNHVHLALQVAEIALAQPMQNLSFRYTRWINRRQRRIGHLFQGRYRALLVERDSYLLELVRYIHLNPVRANLVTDPAEYRWSGHRAYLDDDRLPWLTTEWVLSQFSQNPRAAAQSYQRFIQEGIGGRHAERFHAGSTDTRILGSDRFIERVLGPDVTERCPPPSLSTIVQAVCQTYGLSPDELTAPGTRRLPAQARALVALIATQTGAASLTAVAQHFGRDVATLSTGIRRLTLRVRAGEDHHAPWREPIQRFNVKL